MAYQGFKHTGEYGNNRWDLRGEGTLIENIVYDDLSAKNKAAEQLA